MQFLLTFESDSSFSLPLHYNHLIQGFIYEAIDPELSSFLHDHGYQVDGRPFRLFTFSRILGKYQLNRKTQTMIFEPRVKLWISSPIEDFCQSLAKNVIRRGDLYIGSHLLHSAGYKHISPAVSHDFMVVRTQSPVTVYSTLLRPDGRKFTAYFQPGEPDYNRLITENLQRKYQAAYHRDPPSGEVSVQARSTLKLNIVKYKDFIVKGYSGKLQINGPSPLLQIALEAGLGAKNSQGFGFVQIN